MTSTQHVKKKEAHHAHQHHHQHHHQQQYSQIRQQQLPTNQMRKYHLKCPQPLNLKRNQPQMGKILATKEAPHQVHILKAPMSWDQEGPRTMIGIDSNMVFLLDLLRR